MSGVRIVTAGQARTPQDKGKMERFMRDRHNRVGLEADEADAG